MKARSVFTEHCCVLGTVLGPGDTVGSKTAKVSVPIEIDAHVYTIKKQTNKLASLLQIVL